MFHSTNGCLQRDKMLRLSGNRNTAEGLAAFHFFQEGLQLLEILSEHVARHDTQHWLRTCAQLEIPAAPVARMDELPQDPHLVATGFFATVRDPAMGEVRFPRSSVRFDGAQVPIGMPPRLCQHTEELLRAAGLDDAQLAALQPSEPSTA